MAVRRVRCALGLVLAALWLTACQRDMTLKVSTDSLSFDGQSGQAPGDQTISCTIQPLDRPVYVGVFCSDTGVAQCSYDLSANPFTVRVTPRNPFDLPAGTHKDQVIIQVCEDEACKKPLAGSPKVLTVRYTTQAPIWLQPAAVSFSSVLGSSLPPSEESVRLYAPASFTWTASADQGWIQLPRTEGDSWYGDSFLPVQASPTGLAVGSYSGSVTLTQTKTGNHQAIPVTLEVHPATLSTAPQTLALGGTDGTDLSPQHLAVSFDTGSNAYAWTATVDTGSDPRWLVLSSTSGTTSSSPAELTASVNATGLHSGTYSARVTFTATVAGQAVSTTVPVSLRLAEHALWVPENGVALVSTPSFSKLTRTVTLKDSWGRSTTPWTARSNQSWLQVTPGGTVSEPLTLTASPAGLAADTLHSATVTLSSSDGSVTHDETIQVGLWVGSQASNSQDKVFESTSVLEVDPIRPQAYLHDGSGTLSVYNLHTAALITRLTGPSSHLGQMAVSSDGSTLYVLDTDNHRVVPVDLRTLTVGTPWDTGLSNAWSLHYARPSGHGVLLINGDHAFDASTGVAFPTVKNGLTDGLIFGRVSKDGALLCGQGYYYSSRFTECWSLRYSSLDGGSVALKYRGSPDVNTYSVTDVAISPDGSRVYSSLYNHLGVAVFDGKTLEQIGLTSWGGGSASALAVGPEGQLYEAMGSYPDINTHDLRVADSAGSQVSSFRMADYYSHGIEERQLRVSGDGKRLVALVDRGVLKFATVP